MKQSYHKYTAEDQRVWQLLFERQMKQLPAIASNAYLEGIEKVGFVADHIPNFEAETNQPTRLDRLGGRGSAWLDSSKRLFELLSNRKFPASTWLRKLDQLDYLEEPDMFHDTFGHVPLLTNQAFCDFMGDLSRIALQWIEVPEVIAQIGRLYWYTVEFGLIREKGQLKIYGGGILSSSGESEYCLSETMPKFPFEASRLLNTPYHIDRFQTITSS
ncbi:MAG: phenylalanine-4-hydroxylase [Spirosomataceae bacterium]